MLRIDFNFSIPDSELKFTFVRSSGPGGQNVNKVNSKAVLSWNVFHSQALNQTPETFRARVSSRLAHRVSADGNVVIASDRFRDQTRNREDCLLKLRALLQDAIAIPKHRKATRPTRASQKRRSALKRSISDKKRLRRKPLGGHE